MASFSATPLRVLAGRQALGALSVAALASGLWSAWMGWDTTYDTNAVTGQTSGPYQAWQVAGCGVSLLAVLVGALLAGVRPPVACAALTLAFTTAWTVAAAAQDDSGLYAVGALLMLGGLAVATALVSLLVIRLARRRRARSAAP